MADDNTHINPANVSTGKPIEGGCAYVGFGTVTIPTDATTDITGSNSGFENLGELSDQGWTQSTSTNVNKFKGYHGSTLLSEAADEETTVKFEMVEVERPAAAKLRYGEGNVTVNTDGEITAINPTTVPSAEVVIVIDELLSNGRKQRTVFPRAKINTIDDQAHQRGSLLVYGCTFDVLVDTNNSPWHQYRATLASAASTETVTNGSGQTNGGQTEGTG